MLITVEKADWNNCRKCVDGYKAHWIKVKDNDKKL